MTVSQLIQVLAGLPSDMPVMVMNEVYLQEVTNAEVNTQGNEFGLQPEIPVHVRLST